MSDTTRDEFAVDREVIYAAIAAMPRDHRDTEAWQVVANMWQRAGVRWIVALDEINALRERVAELEAMLNEGIHLGANGCFSGDCPHGKSDECVAALKSMVDEFTGMLEDGKVPDWFYSLKSRVAELEAGISAFNCPQCGHFRLGADLACLHSELAKARAENARMRPVVEAVRVYVREWNKESGHVAQAFQEACYAVVAYEQDDKGGAS